jgi:hypothetical protein
MTTARRISERAAMITLALLAISVSVLAQPRGEDQRNAGAGRHSRPAGDAPRRDFGHSGTAQQQPQARDTSGRPRAAPAPPAFAPSRGASPPAAAPGFTGARERPDRRNIQPVPATPETRRPLNPPARPFTFAPSPRERIGGARGDFVNRGNLGNRDDNWSRRDFGNRNRGFGRARDHWREEREHHYPARGFVVDRLPGPYRIAWHQRENFFFCDGIWYRPFGARFVVAAAPIGVVIPVLPSLYVTLWGGGTPYYYANDTYYRWSDADEGYAVVDRPADAEGELAVASSDDIYMYPRENQSDEQQASDRYDCHRWAVGQTGYDPSQSATGTGSQLAGQRANYRRAMQACLDARGYSVT